METMDKNRHWSYPDVEHVNEDGVVASYLKVQVSQLEQRIHQLLQDISLKNEELAKLQQTFQELNAQNKEQAASFNHCLEKLNEALPKLNDTHIDLIANTVGALTKKIIYKELGQDNTIIKKMLTELLGQVGQEEQLIVEVSSSDYDILSKSKFPTNIKLMMKESLEPGDMTVLTKSSAYLQRLSDMIDLIVSK